MTESAFPAPVPDRSLPSSFPIHSDPVTGKRYMPVSLRGVALMEQPLYNKGTAFTLEERRLFHLEGLLPHYVSSIQDQLRRAYENFRRKPTDVERHIYLAHLQDRNETLYFRLLTAHLEEMLPIVYTPTIGQVCKEYSHLYRRPRGLYITPDDIHRIDSIFSNVPFADVRVIVVTDNERILGLGDLGVGGIGIPIGKLAIYTAAAGIHPSHCLPVSLDVGTDNPTLLKDPLYLGYRKPRLRGKAYHRLLDAFVGGVRKRFPNALIQWEDFSKRNAFTVLDRYREKVCSFNDDIQGTGAVALAGILAALRITGGRLADQRVVVLGTGGAGVGIARQLVAGMQRQGLSEREAKDRLWMIDSQGLVIEGGPDVEPHKLPFRVARDRVAGWRPVPGAPPLGLLHVVENVKPTILIGVSGQPGAFTEQVVRAMNAHCARPVVMALSNPTSHSEATPDAIYRWTRGRALVATGSPFPDVVYADRRCTISQGNNAFIFPGVGLAAMVARPRLITDAMFTQAARALADCVTTERLKQGALYPPVRQIRKVARRVAETVAREAVRSARADALPESEIPERIRQETWIPKYLPYRPG